MTDNPQQPPRPGDPHRPEGPGEEARTYGPPPHGGQQPYGDQPYAQPQQPYEGQMPDPGLYPGSEYPPDRTTGHLPPSSAGGFFGALFDFSFSRYITPTVVKVVYIVVIVLTALYWLVGLVASFAQEWWVGILFLFFGWVVALVYIAFVRIVLECFVALISIAEKVNAYARRDRVS